jgi:hypothetical protein
MTSSDRLAVHFGQEVGAAAIVATEELYPAHLSALAPGACGAAWGE